MDDDRQAGAREWDAAEYDRVGGHMAQRGAAVLDRLDLRGDETVLDAGCGTGRVTALLLERLPRGRVIGLDGSRAMLEQAQGRLGADARVELVHADLTRELPIVEPVDLIVSTSTLHWVPDHASVFRRLGVLLAPGGRLCVDCGGAGNIAAVRDAIEAAGESWSPWNFRSAEEAREDLAGAGFTAISTWLATDPLELAREDLPGYLRTVILGSHLERIPETRHDAFVAAVAEAMDRPLIDYVRLNIDARRAAPG